MARRRSQWLAGVVVVTLGLAAAWWLGPPAPEAPRAAPPGPVELPRSPAPPAAREAPATSAPPPPPVSASAPAGCPEDDGDPPDFVRPSVWELLRTRTQELRDRLPQLSRDASPALREGLNGIGGDDPMRAVDRLRAAPDRERDGFDVATAAMLHLGMRALAEDDATSARYWARAAIREAPTDPAGHALAGLAAEHADARLEAREALGRAHALAADEPALALALARAQADAGLHDEALRAVAIYLEQVPEDARIVSWRTRIEARAELTRTHARRTDLGITTLWPDRSVDVRRIDELSSEAHDAMREVAARIGRSPREELVVVVYESMEDLRRATCAPSWSGGIFDGVLHLDAATLRGPRATRVVRHEATHAQLRSIRGSIPSWLNEGMAQEMEGPTSPAARAAWGRMVARAYWIPFESLEGELVVIDDPEAAGLAYHQSLAMFLFLRERGGPEAVREAFARVDDGRPEDLLPTLVAGADGAALLAFVGERLH
ncbi:MAG: hypothetical protein H6719_27245 [Sandaracinaceae bacterium]|nr:hypothetical protein [Sandaracinaceae bacterium]